MASNGRMATTYYAEEPRVSGRGLYPLFVCHVIDDDMAYIFGCYVP